MSSASSTLSTAAEATVKRVAIVTGAARGLGAAVATALAARGDCVVICDIETELLESVARDIRASRGNDERAVLPLVCDISKPSECDRVVSRTVERYGRLDILVNNAAVCPRLSIDDMTEEAYDRIMNVNVKSCFFLSRAAGNAMKLTKYGRIVNVSSTGARTGGIYNATVYSASKSGMVSMTKAFARHFAPSQILVNAVCPGTVDTRLMQNLAADALQASINAVPLKRLAQPNEIASVICFLASEEQSYMTGSTVDVNGGAVMT